MNTKEDFDSAFRELLINRWADTPLLPVMEYGLFPGGKRLRPLLCQSIGRELGGTNSESLGVAAAVECLHIASLLHDDLPCLDDDSYRRGLPTCHVRFGEAAALLAGDALVSWAFEIAATSSVRAEIAVRVLGRSFSDLCLGQYQELVDPQVIAGSPSLVAELKTGALFAASLHLGCIASPRYDIELGSILSRIGMDFGVLFQAHDDREDGDHGNEKEEVLAQRISAVRLGFTSLHDKTGMQFLETRALLTSSVGGIALQL